MLNTAEFDLMQRVNRLAGPYLAKFAPTTTTPISFWAALTANESGAYLIHDTHIPARFEAGVMQCLIETAQGTRHHYGGIYTEMLQTYQPKDLRPLASSWGFTQVMGLHAFAWGRSYIDLDNPETHYQLAARLLAEFIERFDLDNQKDFNQMFHCWNTGRIDGSTHDPKYMENGLRRMQIWNEHLT